jgi:hypothetical protein
MNIFLETFSLIDSDVYGRGDPAIPCILLSANACKGNDGKFCPLLHGSIAPKLFGKVGRFVYVDQLLLRSNNATWIPLIKFPITLHGDLTEFAQNICRTLSSLKYSAKSIKTVKIDINLATDPICSTFIREHCTHLEDLKIFSCYGLDEPPNISKFLLGDDFENNNNNYWAAASRLEKLSFESMPILDEDFAKISPHLRSLRSLSMTLTNDVFTGETSFQNFGSKRTIRTLDFTNNSNCLSETAFIYIGEMTSLVSLILAHCAATNTKCLQHLADLVSLELLDLRGCELLEDDSMLAIAEFGQHSLQTLKLGFIRPYASSPQTLTDVALEHLSKLTNLKQLDFLRAGDNYTEKGFATLFGGLRNLEEFSMELQTAKTDREALGVGFIESLASISSLKDIFLGTSGFGPTSAHLTKECYFALTNIKNEKLHANLEMLDISSFNSISDDTIMAVCSSFQKLQHLTFPEDLQTVDRSKLTVVGVHQSMSCVSPLLTSLDLNNFQRNVNDDVVEVICDRCPLLEHLSLINCDISDKCLRFVASNLLSLKFLDLSEAEKITNKGISEHVSKCPRLSMLTLVRTSCTHKDALRPLREDINVVWY